MSAELVRVWLVDCAGWSPTRWDETPPPGTVAIEPAVNECFTTAEAEAFLEVFNQAMLERHSEVWAVRVPVSVCLHGDVFPGAVMS